ncbi:MAG: ECF transporter S component [Clostridia bacterium]|nr:ECF transporter S component [Clostridia bacterium]MBQ6172896.1 ECF transporter S component [Clostridia bacterium]
MAEKRLKKRTTVWLCVTALFMAINIVMSMSIFSIPVPGGHLYLNDIIICVASILLDPFGAFMVGGVGAFLGDFFFYPTPMFVSLVTHGLQAVAISLISHYTLKKHPAVASGIGVTVGAVIMIAGYSIGRAFFYSTPETALIKLPYQTLQAAVGAVFGMLICWKLGIRKLFNKLMEK